jgi:hypothetical protein
VTTSDAGLLAYRELDDTLALTRMASDMLADARTGRNGRHEFARSRSPEPEDHLRPEWADLCIARSFLVHPRQQAGTVIKLW